MKVHDFSAIIIALIFIFYSAGHGQQSAGQLLQSGIYKEEVQGELKEAIEIYETILSTYPENRPVAAKAFCIWDCAMKGWD